MFIEGFWKATLAALDAIIKRTKDMARAEITDANEENSIKMQHLKASLKEEISRRDH